MCDSSSQRRAENGVRLGLIAAAIAVAPLFLPRRPRVVRRVVIQADPAHIFPLVNDLRNWPRWAAWNQRDEIAYAYEGPPAGVGATQHWSSRGHSGTLHMKQSVEGERLAYSFTMDEREPVEGVIALEEIAPHQTLVTWVTRWQGARRFWMRYLDLLGMWWLGRDFTLSLQNLRHLAETTAPIPEATGAEH